MWRTPREVREEPRGDGEGRPRVRLLPPRVQRAPLPLHLPVQRTGAGSAGQVPRAAPAAAHEGDSQGAEVFPQGIHRIDRQPRHGAVPGQGEGEAAAARAGGGGGEKGGEPGGCRGQPQGARKEEARGSRRRRRQGAERETAHRDEAPADGGAGRLRRPRRRLQGA